MNGHELIEKGIKYNDMDLVAEGNRLLSQEGVEYAENPSDDSTETSSTPILGSASSRRSTNMDEFKRQIRNTDNDSIESRTRDDGGTYAKKEPINTKKVGAFNMFEDDLSDGVKDLKKNIDKKLYPKKKRRPAPPSRLREVKCDGCNNNFQVAPILVRSIEGQELYTCDRCIMRKGTGNRNVGM